MESLTSGVELHAGDCLDVLPRIAENSIDAVVTDPPYHLTSIVKRFGGNNAAPAQFGKDGAYARASAGFMNCKWDGGDIAFRPETWAAVWRVLKPGGHMLVFGGSRTYGRLQVAIEEAGFEVRDTIAWVFGSGFPKSHSMREIGRPELGTALKPAMELICLARKPLSEKTVAANVLKWGTGAVNIDATRVTTSQDDVLPDDSLRVRHVKASMGYGGSKVPFNSGGNVKGRWPSNLAHDGSDEVVREFPEVRSPETYVRKADGINKEIYGAGIGERSGKESLNFGDSGSAARFFYTAKAGSDDRLGSGHPTVKPVDLIQWLCRMITPPGGTVLDPFAGTGTTGEACIREGFKAVLIEREEAYCADIRRRMKLAMSGLGERKRESIKARGEVESPGPLFEDRGGTE